MTNQRETLVIKLETMRDLFAYWKRSAEERYGPGSDGYIRTVPTQWPTVDAVQAWVDALDEAILDVRAPLLRADPPPSVVPTELTQQLQSIIDAGLVDGITAIYIGRAIKEILFDARSKWADAQGAIYAALGWLESDRDVGRAIEILRAARDPGPYHQAAALRAPAGEHKHRWILPTPPVKASNYFCGDCGFFPGPSITEPPQPAAAEEPEAIGYLRDLVELTESIGNRLSKEHNWNSDDRLAHKIEVEDRAVVMEQAKVFLSRRTATK